MRVLTRSDVWAAIVLLSWATSVVAAETQPPLPEAKPIPVAEPVAEAEAPVARAERVPQPIASPAAAAPLSVTLHLNIGNPQLRGVLLSSPEFTMKTSFGELVIPMSQVAGIKMASEANTSTTVVMHNGDTITGAWNLDRLELQTEWGTATVDGGAINSILFAADMAWVAVRGLSGTRWGLLAKPEGAESGAPAGDLKPGDVIVVTQQSELKLGSEVVGQVNQDEVLAIEGVLKSFFYVNTGEAAGWISKENVAPYEAPGSDDSEAASEEVGKRAPRRTR